MTKLYTCGKGTQPPKDWLSVYVGALGYGGGHRGSICKDSEASTDAQRLKTITTLAVYCFLGTVQSMQSY